MCRRGLWDRVAGVSYSASPPSSTTMRTGSRFASSSNSWSRWICPMTPFASI
uniref:Predicted protein n=1 Tax=Hordeum vulgare subsp. vulgare TaxID=112509 RepID=F2CZA9_HORVV|nr:predicted protein [Hordeum vulgare subsp. vulgare]